MSETEKNAVGASLPRLVRLPVMVRLYDHECRQWDFGPITVEIDENTDGVDCPFEAFSLLEKRAADILVDDLDVDIVGGLQAEASQVGPNGMARVLKLADDAWRKERGYTGTPVRRPLYWQHMAEAVLRANGQRTNE